MHSKVIIAALVVGLGLGFKFSVKDNAKMAAQPVVENDVCDTCEHVEHAQRTLQPKKVAASQSVRPDLFITRARTNSVSSGGSNWYTFTAPFDGKFWFESSDNGSMDPIAQIYLGLGTNYGTVSIDEGNRDDANGRNFRFALELDCAETVYIQVRDYYNNSGSYKITASHTHEFNDRTAYYTSSSHKVFCRCGAYTTAQLIVDDEFNGHGRNMVHCSVCDNWIDLIPEGHTHSYGRKTYYNQTSHSCICECGYLYRTSHSFDAIYTVGDYQVKHCSGCNAWIEVYAPHTHSFTYSREYLNEAKHKNVCSCGAYQTQEHTFDSIIAIGHGHNDMIHCSVCDSYVELGIVSLNNPASGSFGSDGAKWLMFKAENAGTYSISLAGSYNMYMEFYFGNYPTSRYTYFTTENIGRVTYSRSYSAGETAFIRVRSANWSAANYTVSVALSHTHNYNQLVNYGNSQNHKLVCSCGQYQLQNHTFSNAQTYTNRYHKLVCDCGYEKLVEHTFDSFFPYGHGHNDMLVCSECGGGVDVTEMSLGTEYSGDYGYDGADWYFFIPEEDGTYIFETLGTTDTYGKLYVGNNPAAATPIVNDDDGQGDNFKIIAENLRAYDMVFLRVSGDPDPYRVRVTKMHEHNYTQIVDYNYDSHKIVCECGEFITEPHSYDEIETWNNGFHKRVCACGRYITEEHTFNSFLPYGHGHNDMLICSECGCGVDVTEIVEGQDYSGAINVDDCVWFFFVPEQDGRYVFETTGGSDTVGELYIGDIPTVIADNGYNDDDGVGNNFRLEYDLEEGQRVFLRVRGYDWYSEVDDYTLTVNRIA